MNQPPADTHAQATARQRYMVMNLVRFGSIGAIIFGIATAQGVLPAPYALGVVAAVAGVATFFFGPPLLARRWKDGDRERDGQ